MNTKEKYNKIIMAIEAGSCDSSIKCDELAYSVAMGFGKRAMNEIFSFLTGYTLLDYIKCRKMMAAYRYLISTKKRDIEGAIGISGLGDHSAFDKKFSKYFNMTPKEAHQKKNKSLLTKPLTWDEISCDMTCPTLEEEEVEQMEKKSRFGISQEQYAKVMEASELEAVYGFEPMFSQVAFELADSLKLPMEDTFRFVDSLRDFGGDFNDDDPEEPDGKTPEERLRELAFNHFIQFMYFERGLSIDLICVTLDRVSLSKEELMQLSPDLIRAYAYTENLQFVYFKKAYEYYKCHADDSYTEEEYDMYIDLICMGRPIEEAFGILVPMGDSNINDSEMFLMEQEQREMSLGYFDPIERMAEEDARWNGARIDSDYDEENATYEDDASDLFS